MDAVVLGLQFYSISLRHRWSWRSPGRAFGLFREISFRELARLWLHSSWMELNEIWDRFIVRSVVLSRALEFSNWSKSSLDRVMSCSYFDRIDDDICLRKLLLIVYSTSKRAWFPEFLAPFSLRYSLNSTGLVSALELMLQWKIKNKIMG